MLCNIHKHGNCTMGYYIVGDWAVPACHIHRDNYDDVNRDECPDFRQINFEVSK